MTSLRRCHTITITLLRVSREHISVKNATVEAQIRKAKELNLRLICTTEACGVYGRNAMGTTQRRVEEENGFGRSLASSAGSNLHNARRVKTKRNTAPAQQTGVLSNGNARMRAPT